MSNVVRKNAILMCAIAACEPASVEALALSQVDYHLDLESGEAFELARAARILAVTKDPTLTYELSCAEAECLLREGWTTEKWNV